MVLTSRAIFAFTRKHGPTSLKSLSELFGRGFSAGPVIFCLLLSVVFAGSVAAFVLPDTGQTKCYNTSGAEIVCTDPAGIGQDGAVTINQPYFTSFANNNVTDSRTGLMWRKQDNGTTTYNWYQATGNPDATNPGGSTNACGSLSVSGTGFSDWRLPTEKELMSILDYSVTSGYLINSTYFTTPHANIYWSSASFAADSTKAWVVWFNTGVLAYYSKTNSFNVLCVRAGYESDQRLSDNHDGTVTDSATGLTWQLGEPTEGSMTWANALTYCHGRTLGNQTDWRLPNIKELESLVDNTKNDPSINALFSDAVPTLYLSSTTDALANPGPGNAWYINFSDGTAGYVGKSVPWYVRCVRGGINTCPDNAAASSTTGQYYLSIQSAYNVSANSALIEMQAMDFSENVDLESAAVTLQGGYVCGFASAPGFTTLHGKLTVGNGAAMVANLILQ